MKNEFTLPEKRSRSSKPNVLNKNEPTQGTDEKLSTIPDAVHFETNGVEQTKKIRISAAGLIILVGAVLAIAALFGPKIIYVVIDKIFGGS